MNLERGRRLLHLADGNCTRCFGAGWFKSRWRDAICPCVFRCVFRHCLNRRNQAILSEDRRWKALEFCADFELLARRSLDEVHFDIFDLHFLQGFDWRRCAGSLGIDRGNFFHAVYRLERALGCAYIECGLFPTDEYFSSRERPETRKRDRDWVVEPEMAPVSILVQAGAPLSDRGAELLAQKSTDAFALAPPVQVRTMDLQFVDMIRTAATKSKLGRRRRKGALATRRDMALRLPLHLRERPWHARG